MKERFSSGFEALLTDQAMPSPPQEGCRGTSLEEGRSETAQVEFERKSTNVGRGLTILLLGSFEIRIYPASDADFIPYEDDGHT